MVPKSDISLAPYLRQNRVRTIEGFRAAAVEKVAVVFNSIAQEADAAAKAEFERLGSMSVHDETYIAECATERGINYYETMSGVRQGVLNLLAVGLHHLLEQQQLSCLRWELGGGPGDERALQPADFEQRLADLRIDCRSFGCAAKLYELRTAANAIKHGAGHSARTLATLRPDLFRDPALATCEPAAGSASGSGSGRALRSSPLQPLAGSDIYVTERDLSDWCGAMIAYWQELSKTLDEHGQLGQLVIAEFVLRSTRSALRSTLPGRFGTLDSLNKGHLHS